MIESSEVRGDAVIYWSQKQNPNGPQIGVAIRNGGECNIASQGIAESMFLAIAMLENELGL